MSISPRTLSETRSPALLELSSLFQFLSLTLISFLKIKSTTPLISVVTQSIFKGAYCSVPSSLSFYSSTCHLPHLPYLPPANFPFALPVSICFLSTPVLHTSAHRHLCAKNGSPTSPHRRPTPHQISVEVGEAFCMPTSPPSTRKHLGNFLPETTLIPFGWMAERVERGH